MKRMVFSVDKSVIREGDVVTLTWDCPQGERANLCIDNGYKESSMEVAPTGEKKIRLNRSKGYTKLTLTATVGGKQKERWQLIRVKPPKKVKAEPQYDAYERIDAKGWKAWCRKVRDAWNAQTPQRRQSFVMLLCICVIMVISSFYPVFATMGLCLLGLYLLINLIR